MPLQFHNENGINENLVEYTPFGRTLGINKIPPGFHEYAGRESPHFYGDYKDKVYDIMNPDKSIGEWLKYDILYVKVLDRSWKWRMDEGDRIDYTNDPSFSGDNAKFQENTFIKAISRYGNHDTLEGLDFFLKATQAFLESLTDEQKEKYAPDIAELQRLVDERLPRIMKIMEQIYAEEKQVAYNYFTDNALKLPSKLNEQINQVQALIDVLPAGCVNLK